MDTTALRRAGLIGVLVLAAEPAAAHAGSLRVSGSAPTIPTWLVVLTGGGIIAASFLLASLVTDHATIRSINAMGKSLPTGRTARFRMGTAARVAGLLGFVVILVTGLLGPRDPLTNFAVLVVWAGWWAGYTMSVYLVGNTWPVLNPWRTIASWLPRPRDRSDLDRFGPWPSVVGLLALVLIEVISPVAEDPRLLTIVILGYTGVTFAGAALVGADAWFTRVDPITRVFRCYGRLAPVQRSDEGLTVGLPSAALARSSGAESVPFVIALLWSTTYDGLVSTPAWADLIRPLVAVGLPALLVYLLAIAAGYGLFLGAYRLASVAARRTASTFVTLAVIERRFVSSLIPIAAGYHLAHFLGLLIGLSPLLVRAFLTPFGPPMAGTAITMPPWFGILGLVFILVGHLFAIWVAHTTAFDIFTGRLQPIRSQYPFIVAMVFYTMTSMWLIAQPSIAPPFL